MLFSKRQAITSLISLMLTILGLATVYLNDNSIPGLSMSIYNSITSRFSNITSSKPPQEAGFEHTSPEIAIQRLETLIAANPTNPAPYYILGRIYQTVEFPEGYYYQKMSYYYQRYLELSNNGPMHDTAKLALAKYYIQQGLTQGKVDLLDKALKLLHTLDQNDAEVKMALGAIYLDKKNYDQAISAFAGSINLDTDEMKLKYNSLGLAYIKKGEYKPAKSMLEIAVKIDPSDKYAHNNLGFVHLRCGDLTEARTEFRKAVALDPSYTKAKTNLEYADKALQK